MKQNCVKAWSLNLQCCNAFQPLLFWHFLALFSGSCILTCEECKFRFEHIFWREYAREYVNCFYFFMFQTSCVVNAVAAVAATRSVGCCYGFSCSCWWLGQSPSFSLFSSQLWRLFPSVVDAVKLPLTLFTKLFCGRWCVQRTLSREPLCVNRDHTPHSCEVHKKRFTSTREANRFYNGGCTVKAI